MAHLRDGHHGRPTRSRAGHLALGPLVEEVMQIHPGIGVKGEARRRDDSIVAELLYVVTLHTSISRMHDARRVITSRACRIVGTPSVPIPTTIPGLGQGLTTSNSMPAPPP